MTHPDGNWQRHLASAICSLDELGLSPDQSRRLEPVIRRFPLRIPRHLLRRMDLTNPKDPVRRQLLPDARELKTGGAPDPLEEESFIVGRGVIRRFEDRLLALVSATCPLLCRHCNRKRHWIDPMPTAGPADVALALRRNPEMVEVILSGGEPLLLSDPQLADMLEAARSRNGILVVRIHSRIAFSLPQRITSALVRLLKHHQPLWLVHHFNHAQELSPQTLVALGRLRDAGIPMLNQAVLLRGVNDSVETLADLGWALVSAGVKPYYLFQLDRACGTLHFQVPLKRSMELVHQLRTRHSGLLSPQLVVDVPGRGGKVPLNSDAIVRWNHNSAMIRGLDGRTYTYQD